ncbi:MAG: hypothetical protein PHX82_09075 [Paracoccaceae bacterium]|jgi:hypothetical protein|nr:hypothetical protein [Paracoccaceae bacterium]
MKRIALSLVLVTLTAASAMADSFSFDIPRIDFPGQGGQVTQLCNPLVQSCDE